MHGWGNGDRGVGAYMAEGSLHGPSTVGKWAVCRPPVQLASGMLYCKVFLSIELNSIRLGGPARGIVTKTVHKTLPRACWDLGGGGR